MQSESLVPVGSLILMAILGYGHAQSPLFQCQPSSAQNGLVFTPNIPDLYFNHENADSFRNSNITVLSHGSTFIFPIPPESAERDCSGTVVEMQFCYQYEGNTQNLGEISAFKFLSLTKNGAIFTVNSSVTVATTVLDSICTGSEERRICCSVSTSNDLGKLEIPSTDYIFGIAPTNSSLLLLAFAPSVSEYQFDQFQVASFPSTPGATTQLTGDPISRSLLIFRLLIDPSNGNDGSRSETSTSDNMDISGPTEMNTSEQNTVSNALIGGVAGGAAAAILLLLIILCVVILLVIVGRRRSSSDTKDTSYNNAVYEMTESAREKAQPTVMSEGGPPPAYSVVDMSKKKKKENCRDCPRRVWRKDI